jgi:hypothetical protein
MGGSIDRLTSLDRLMPGASERWLGRPLWVDAPRFDMPGLPDGRVAMFVKFTSLGTLIRGRLMRRLMLFAVMRQRVNVTTASIPGPTVPLYLTGARVLEVFPVLPLIANEPLGVSAEPTSRQGNGRVL